MIRSGFKVKARAVYGGRNLCSHALSLPVAVFYPHVNVLYYSQFLVSLLFNSAKVYVEFHGEVAFCFSRKISCMRFYFFLEDFTFALSVSSLGTIGD